MKDLEVKGPVLILYTDLLSQPGLIEKSVQVDFRVSSITF